MPSKTSLNLANLEALGAARLAEIVLDMATGNATAKRRLRMELAGDESPTKLAHAIRKRLSEIAQSDRYIGWRSIRPFITDLEAQRGFIRRLADFSTQDALELAWQLLRLCNNVLERSTDPSGEIFAVFTGVAMDIGSIASRSSRAPDTLVADLHAAMKENIYGQSDGLILALAPVIGRDGLIQLDTCFHAEPPPGPEASSGRRVSRWVRGRTLETETIAARRPDEIIRAAAIEIAEGLGDIDRYIALQTDPDDVETTIRIAERLIGAGRANHALTWLDRVIDTPRGLPDGWLSARLAALEALGHTSEAQAFRWHTFETRLDTAALRDYLKRLPDFDAIEAEDRAMRLVAVHPDASAALRFFIEWPRLDEAAALVVVRLNELDGSDTANLQTAAEKLTNRYPLASVLLLRHAVGHILAKRASEGYERAAHMWADLTRLSLRINDWAGWPDDAAYQETFKRQFGSVSAFWQVAA